MPIFIISDPPEITVERSWVHTGEGFRAELLCTVLADPPAEVYIQTANHFLSLKKIKFNVEH